MNLRFHPPTKFAVGLTLALLAALAPSAGAADAAKPVYQNSFENTALDKAPDDFLILDGGFAVKQEGDNKFLELPGAPLDSFGLLFGPAGSTNLSVTARIFGTGKGRRYPTMGVGLNGLGGYKLKVNPGKNALELFKGDDVVVTTPFKWESGTWTQFRLEIKHAGESLWKIQGKVWKQTGEEPKDWQVAFDEKAQPTAGRPTLWGSPYSGTPIRFDDLKVSALR